MANTKAPPASSALRRPPPASISQLHLLLFASLRPLPQRARLLLLLAQIVLDTLCRPQLLAQRAHLVELEHEPNANNAKA